MVICSIKKNAAGSLQGRNCKIKIILHIARTLNNFTSINNNIMVTSKWNKNISALSFDENEPSIDRNANSFWILQLFR